MDIHNLGYIWQREHPCLEDFNVSSFEKRSGYWKLVIGEEPKATTRDSIVNSPKNILKSVNGEEGAKKGLSNASINKSIKNRWKVILRTFLCTIALYLTNESLQTNDNCKTSKEAWNALNFIYSMGDQNTKTILQRMFWSHKTNVDNRIAKSIDRFRFVIDGLA